MKTYLASSVWRYASLAALFLIPLAAHLRSQSPLSEQVARTPTGQWQLSWNSQEGEQYVVQRSTDLELWTDVETVIATGTFTTFVDTDAPAGRTLFWRIQYEGEDGTVLIAPFSIIELIKVNTAGEPVAPGTADADWRVTWESQSGADYKLQRSADGVAWVDVATVKAVADTTSYIDVDAPVGLRLLWRVVGLSVGGTGPVTISEVTPQLSGGGGGGGSLAVEIDSEVPLDSVVFYDGDTPLGHASPGLGGSWSVPLAVDPELPRIVHLSVQVNPSEGEAIVTDPLGLLVADTSKFVPLSAEGAPGYGNFVPVGEGDALGRFAFYPEGLGDARNTTGAHFVFEAGSTLDEAAGGAVVAFSSATFHRGHFDPEPLPSLGGGQQIDLDVVSPGVVLSSFDSRGEGAISLLWEGNAVGWSGGELVAGGWSELHLLPPIDGLVFPAGLGEVGVVTDPASGELYLVICFHGDWAPAAGGTTFRVPQADPLKVYLYPDGRISASGTAEAVFPDGAVLRGSIAWREPVFEVRIEGRGFTIPALGSLRSQLPTVTASAAIPAGTRSDSLDIAAMHLEGMRDAMRGVAAAGSGQATIDSDASYPAPAGPADSGGSTLRAWAGRLVSWEADRAGEKLTAVEMTELATLLRGAGRQGEGAFDLATPMGLLIDVLRINGAADAAIDASAEAVDLLAAIGETESRLFASARRLASSTSGSNNVLERALLLERIDSVAIGASAAGRARRDGASLRQARIDAIKTLLRANIDPRLFSARAIQFNDLSGLNNPVLTAMDEEALLGFLAELLGVKKVFGLASVISPVPGALVPLQEAWDQASDVFRDKHNSSVQQARVPPDFGRLRRVIAHRVRYFELQAELGWPLYSDFGTFQEEGGDGFFMSTSGLVESYIEEQRKLPSAAVAEVCLADLQTLDSISTFTRDAGQKIDLEFLHRRASACKRAIAAQSASGAICDEVRGALTRARLTVEDAPLGDEGARTVRLTGRYELTEVTPGRTPVTMQLSQAGRLILGNIQYHGTILQVSNRERVLGMLKSETANSAEFSVLLREDPDVFFLGNPEERVKRVLVATKTATGVNLVLKPIPGEQGSTIKFVKTSEFAPFSASMKEVYAAEDDPPRNFSGEAGELFDAQQNSPMHSSQIETLRAAAPGIRTKIDSYLAGSTGIQRSGRAVFVGNALADATKNVTLSQIPLARQVVCEVLSRTSKELNGEEISYWDWVRIIFARHRNDGNSMKNYIRFMGPSQANDFSGESFKYTIHIEQGGAAVDAGLASIGAGGATIEINKMRVGAAGSGDDIMLAGVLGQAGAGYGWGDARVGGGAGSDDIVVYSDIEYSEQALSGPIMLIGATAGIGIGVDASAGPLVLMMYGDRTLPPFGIPLPFTSTANNVRLPSIEMNFGLGYVGSFSTLPPSQFGLTTDPANRKFSASARAGGALHFASGDSVVRDCGWSELRILVAEMRAIFESEDATISILGFTDAAGPMDPAQSDTFNTGLSADRAAAVKAAIITLVGEGLKVKPENIRAFGLGRYPAMERTSPVEADLSPAELAFLANKRASLPDLTHNQSNDDWRTVSIILNNLIHIDLSGAEKPVSSN